MARGTFWACALLKVWIMLGYPEDQPAFDHARSFAQRGGVDLAQAVFDGWLRRDELAVLVATCHSCAAGFPCERDAAEGASAICANAAPFAALALSA